MDDLSIYFYVPIMAWLLLITVLFLVTVKKYTLGQWTAENPNPYSKETLGLPRGIFRAILTMTLLFGAVIFTLFVMTNETVRETDISEFMVAFQMMIAFYFGSKVMHHVTTTNQRKAEAHREEAIEIARAQSPNYPLPPAMAKAKGGGAADNDSDFYDPNSEG